jgi:DNA-binding LacI/PurR family transcriptional regulator
MSPPAPRVRLIDVARAAGVSKTTVSAALNGSGRLPEATRRHVRDVAHRLGYRPNATARLLRAGRTRLLGLAVREYSETPWVYSELAYFSQLVNAAGHTALSHGYGIVLLPTTSPGDWWLDLPLDGVLVIDPTAGDPMVADFLAAGIPVVSDRRALDASGRPDAAESLGRWVDFDYAAAARGVLDHLAASGARRVALITATSTSGFFEESERVYRDWCAERGQEPLLTATAAPGHAPALQAVDELLASAGEPPDALFTLVETSPLLLLDRLRRHGLSVPDDLLLVATTEDPTAAYSDPPVTTLSFLPAETAEAGVELLVDAFEGRDTPRGRLFTARLDIRTSSTSAQPPSSGHKQPAPPGPRSEAR